MDLSKIIALIDDDLNRLHGAREIIASLVAHPAADARVSDTPQSVEPTALAPPAPAPAAAEVVSRDAVVAPPPVRGARKPREPRAPKARAASTTAPRALGRPADDRPVFVSAEVLSLRPAGTTSARNAAGASPAEKPTSDVLTAKALAQRWISNSLLH